MNPNRTLNDTDAIALVRTVYPDRIPTVDEVCRIAGVHRDQAQAILEALDGKPGTSEVVRELRRASAALARVAALLGQQPTASASQPWTAAAVANARILRLRYPHGLPSDRDGRPIGRRIRAQMRWSADRTAPAIGAYLARADVDDDQERTS